MLFQLLVDNLEQHHILLKLLLLHPEGTVSVTPKTMHLTIVCTSDTRPTEPRSSVQTRSKTGAVLRPPNRLTY